MAELRTPRHRLELLALELGLDTSPSRPELVMLLPVSVQPPPAPPKPRMLLVNPRVISTPNSFWKPTK